MDKLAKLPPDCEVGYSQAQIYRLFDSDQKKYEDFMAWMYGQTMAICDGQKYNYDTRKYEPTACAADPHGVVAYSWDLERYLHGLPIID